MKRKGITDMSSKAGEWGQGVIGAPTKEDTIKIPIDQSQVAWELVGVRHEDGECNLCLPPAIAKDVFRVLYHHLSLNLLRTSSLNLLRTSPHSLTGEMDE